MKGAKQRATRAADHERHPGGADVVLADQAGQFYSIPIGRLTEFRMDRDQIKELTQGDVFARSARVPTWGFAEAAGQKEIIGRGGRGDVPEFDPMAPLAPLPVIAFPVEADASEISIRSVSTTSISLRGIVRLWTARGTP
jgi:hypothetical protein